MRLREDDNGPDLSLGAEPVETIADAACLGGADVHPRRPEGPRSRFRSTSDVGMLSSTNVIDDLAGGRAPGGA